MVSRPSGGVNLAALWIRFQATCMIRAWSAVTWWCRAFRSVTTSSPATNASSRQISTALRIDLVDVHDLEVEPEPPAGDPREVEQVVDQSGLQLDVPADHLQGREERRVGIRLEHRRDGDQHGGQRGAELVAEHGEEPVFGLRGRLGFDAGRLLAEHPRLGLGAARLLAEHADPLGLGTLATGDVVKDKDPA